MRSRGLVFYCNHILIPIWFLNSGCFNVLFFLVYSIQLFEVYSNYSECLAEKKHKRKVKTPAQIEALEKLYSGTNSLLDISLVVICLQIILFLIKKIKKYASKSQVLNWNDYCCVNVLKSVRRKSGCMREPSA